MSRIGIVTGLEFERRILLEAADRRQLPESERPLVACAGGDPDRAREAAGDMARQGVIALLSFGAAGGLDPSVKTGDIVVGSRVVAPDGSVVPLNPEWAQILDALFGARRLPVFGAEIPLEDAAAKAAVHERTRAAVADLESLGVAQAALDAGLHAGVLRVVLDPRDQAIPAAALEAMGPDGRAMVMPVVSGALKRPWETGDLLRLARQAAKVRSVLVDLARRGLPIFGFRHTVVPPASHIGRTS